MLFYVCYPFFLSFLTYSQSFQRSVPSPERGSRPAEVNIVRFPNKDRAVWAKVQAVLFTFIGFYDIIINKAKQNGEDIYHEKDTIAYFKHCHSLYFYYVL